MGKDTVWRYFVRLFMATYLVVLKLSSFIFSRRKKMENNGEYEVLLTGNFYSDNWIYAQLMPLVLSSKVKRIRMVAESPVPELDKVEAVYPCKKLSRVVGRDIARLLTFVWLALTTKTDVVGGFHLLVNGLLAILLGRLTRARSVYVCGGGAREAAGGGYACENKIFGKLKKADFFIERQLLQAVSHADIVIARGQNTIDFFKNKGVDTHFYILPGGIDGSRFKPTDEEKIYDLSLMGRLTTIKRVDTYLRTIEIIHRSKPDIKAAVLGDGPLMPELVALAEELGLSENVDFLGHRDDVDALLPQAKIFVLTSDSEGLSQAMIQAMLCGLPAVVSNVGDLKELIDEGIQGYLIEERTADNFACAIERILDLSETDMATMSKLSRTSALRCDVKSVGERWDEIFQKN